MQITQSSQSPGECAALTSQLDELLRKLRIRRCDAEDIRQDVLLTIINHQKWYASVLANPSSDRSKAILIWTIRKRVADRVRKERRHTDKRVALDAVAELPAPSGDHTEKLTGLRESARALKLDYLDAAIALFLDGVTVDELVQLTGQTRNAVYKRLALGAHALRFLCEAIHDARSVSRAEIKSAVRAREKEKRDDVKRFRGGNQHG